LSIAEVLGSARKNLCQNAELLHFKVCDVNTETVTLVNVHFLR